MTKVATAPPQWNDAELVKAVELGDRRAFEELMRRHNRMLYRVARSILKDDAEAEDALQDGYLLAFRNIKQFRADSAIGTWLGRIVINEAYARLRKSRRSSTILAFPGTDAHDDNSLADVPDISVEQPDAAAMRGQLRAMLERNIEKLPHPFRVVFMLRDVEELSVQQTADCLHLPEATVRTRAFRARALLRASLSLEIDTVVSDAFGFDGHRCDRIVASVLQRWGAIPPDSVSPLPTVNP